ncbi:MAG: hypothetical protein NC203_04670 [Firmicutes bacterium]|nr:hypothetical protein [Bacillota bacterium]
MEDAIKNYRNARKKKAASACVMIFCLILEAAATAIGVTFMEYMILFLVIALILGGCGVAIFFMENLRCNDREGDLAKLLVASGGSYEEICKRAAELKVSKAAVEMFLNKPQEEEAEKISVKGKNKHKKEK